MDLPQQHPTRSASALDEAPVCRIVPRPGVAAGGADRSLQRHDFRFAPMFLTALAIATLGACGGGGGGGGGVGDSADQAQVQATPPAAASMDALAAALQATAEVATAAPVPDPAPAQTSTVADALIANAAMAAVGLSDQAQAVVLADASEPVLQQANSTITPATSIATTTQGDASSSSLLAAATRAAESDAATPGAQSSTPSHGTLRPEDQIAVLDAALPISAQTWNGINCYGRVGAYSSTGSVPIHGTQLADGNTLRFGQTSDPLEPQRQAFVFRVGIQDTLFADSRRCEAVAFPTAHTALPVKQNFWYSISVLVDQGAISHGDGQLITQWHAQGFNPFMGLYLSDGRLNLTIRHSSLKSDTRPYVLTPWVDKGQVQRKWMTFVFNARISPFVADNPFLKVWRDGQLLINYEGPLGYDTTNLPYAKIGFYSWNESNNWDSSAPVRSIYVRRAAITRDPQSKYSEPTMRDWTNRND